MSEVEIDSERINLFVPWNLLREFEEEYKKAGYKTRSEAIREAMRDWIQKVRKRK